MPKATIVFGALLIAVGLFGYFGSPAEKPSPTALIPAAFGVLLAVCGVIAHRPNLRAHAMHAGALIGLIGAVAAIAVAPNLGQLVSDDLANRRPAFAKYSMAIVCLVYVATCVWSFISARRRRAQPSEK